MRSSVKQRLFHIFVFFVVSTVIVSAVQLVRSHQWQSDDLTVWVFDVGQGDAIFIDGPDRQVLIDGGPSGVVLEKLNAALPFWDRHIDMIINTHPHADHVTGLLHTLDYYFVDEFYTGGQEYGTEVFARFQARTSEQILIAGDRIDLGGGAYLDVLWPETSLDGERLSDPNAGSIVLALYYGETSMLLTGDIGIEEELALIPLLDEALLPPGADATDLNLVLPSEAERSPAFDILKVGHQGSLTSTHPDFLDVIQPTYSVISVGENSYGHPSPIVLERLEDAGSTVLRTDANGDVRIWSNGGEPEVAVFGL